MDKEKEVLEEKLKDEIDSMLTNTSCLAIGNIIIRNHPLLKILWCLAFILCTIFTVQQLYGLSKQYFSYPINTIIKLETYHDTFPSITFCNLNPLRKSKLYLAKPELQKFFRELENKNFTVDNKNEIDSRQIDELKFMKLLLNESSEIRRQMGNQIEDFILQCNFFGKTCNLKKLFKPLLSNKFGNCFIFNPSNSIPKLTNIHKRSRSKGLFITFYVQNNEYLQNFISAAGVRIHIHERNSLEIPEIYGMTLPTGFQISLGLVPTKLSRLEEIDGNCERGAAFHNRFNSIYTLEACYTVCLHEQIYRKCGCYDIIFQLFQSNATSLICDNLQKKECLLKVINEFENIRKTCKCKEACNSTMYDIKESFSTWPGASYHKRFFDDLRDIYPNFNNLTENEKYLSRRNFTNVVIYIEDRSHKEIYQIRAYQWDSYLSEIGGTLGLYLGFSVLTAFEFLESIALVMTYVYGKIIYRNTES